MKRATKEIFAVLSQREKASSHSLTWTAQGGAHLHSGALSSGVNAGEWDNFMMGSIW